MHVPVPDRPFADWNVRGNYLVSPDGDRMTPNALPALRGAIIWSSGSSGSIPAARPRPDSKRPVDAAATLAVLEWPASVDRRFARILTGRTQFWRCYVLGTCAKPTPAEMCGFAAPTPATIPLVGRARSSTVATKSPRQDQRCLNRLSHRG